MKKERALRHLLLLQAQELDGLFTTEVLLEAAGHLKVECSNGVFQVRSEVKGKSIEAHAADTDFQFYARSEGTQSLSDSIAATNLQNARAVWRTLLMGFEGKSGQSLVIARRRWKSAIEPLGILGVAALFWMFDVRSALLFVLVHGLLRFLGVGLLVSALLSVGTSLYGLISSQSPGGLHLLALATGLLLLISEKVKSLPSFFLAGFLPGLAFLFDTRLGLIVASASLLLALTLGFLAPWQYSPKRLGLFGVGLVSACLLSLLRSGVLQELPGLQEPAWLTMAVQVSLGFLFVVYWFAGTHLSSLPIVLPLYLLVISLTTGAALPELPIALAMTVLWSRHFYRRSCYGNE